MKQKLMALPRQLNSIKRRMGRFYADQSTLEQKIFWGLVPATCLMGIGSVISTVAEKLGLAAVLTGCACIVVSLLLAASCLRHGNDCKRFYKIFCICLNCLLMPMTFYSNGGLRSGMPVFCFGSLLLCCFCSNKHDRFITCTLSYFCCILLFLVTKIFPAPVILIREYFIDYDIIISFAIASAAMMFLVTRALNGYSKQRYKDVNRGLVDSLGAIIEFRSAETGSHVHNIRRFTSILLECANKVCEEADFSAEDIDMISSAAVLHDIGKIAVPDDVLNKPGKLTGEEYDIIKKHPMDGCMMIETMKEFMNPQYFGYCYEICRHHHEQYDGHGYPDGLQGSRIPLISQIVSIADVYEALTNKRVYKRSFSIEEATDIVIQGSGSKFSPQIISCFLEAKPRLDEIIISQREENERNP